MVEYSLVQTGTILDEQIEFSLLQLCRYCDVNARHVAEMVEEGVVMPSGPRPGSWRFSGHMMRRVQTVIRLERDLDINLSGAALIIELLEEIESLKRKTGK